MKVLTDLACKIIETHKSLLPQQGANHRGVISAGPVRDILMFASFNWYVLVVAKVAYYFYVFNLCAILLIKLFRDVFEMIIFSSLSVSAPLWLSPCRSRGLCVSMILQAKSA